MHWAKGRALRVAAGIAAAPITRQTVPARVEVKVRERMAKAGRQAEAREKGRTARAREDQKAGVGIAAVITTPKIARGRARGKARTGRVSLPTIWATPMIHGQRDLHGALGRCLH